MNTDPPWISFGLFWGLTVLALLGDGVCRLLGEGICRFRDRAPAAPDLASSGSGSGGARIPLAEAIGLRILFALAAVPWACMVMDLMRVPIGRWSLSAWGVAAFAAGVLVTRRRSGRTVTETDRPRSPVSTSHQRTVPSRLAEQPASLLRSPAALLLALAAAALVPFSLVHVSLVPVRSYDALVGYDLVGKIMAQEGRLVSSVFSRLFFNAQCVYAPFTAANNGYWYIFHPAVPRLWIPLLTAGTLLAVWSWVRRRTGSPTAAGLVAFTMFLPTSFLYQLTVAQTDLPSMTFTALAIFAMVDLLRNRGGTAPVAIYLLAATTARTENVLFGAAFTLAALVRSFSRRDPAQPAVRWRSLWLTLAPAAFFLYWNLVVVRLQMGYNPSQHFLREIPLDPGRAVEVIGRALRIIAAPADFGELVWLAVLVPILWAVGRWRAARAGTPDRTAEEAGVTGPVLALLGIMFLFYMPYFYMWDPVYNPLWTMEHTFKRGFFRFIPPILAAFVSAPWVLSFLRRCDGSR